MEMVANFSGQIGASEGETVASLATVVASFATMGSKFCNRRSRKSSNRNGLRTVPSFLKTFLLREIPTLAVAFGFWVKRSGRKGRTPRLRQVRFFRRARELLMLASVARKKYGSQAAADAVNQRAAQ